MTRRRSTALSRRRQPVYYLEFFGDMQRRYHCLGCPESVQVPEPLIAGAVACCPRCGCRVTLWQGNPWREERPWQAERDYWFALDGGGNGEGTVKAQDIYLALRARHPEPDWVFLPQVRTRTGYSRTSGTDMDSERYLDAFAMCCLPAKGFRRVGYEIKVARSDWLREIEDPRKRAQGYFLSHEFWYAVAPGVVKLPDDLYGSLFSQGESPARSRKVARRASGILDGCGILEVRPDGEMVELHRASARTAWPMPETFVASLMRSYVAAHQFNAEIHVPATAEDAAPIATLPLPALLPWEEAE